MSKLIIGVYGCVTIDKYRDQIKKINETWANYDSSIKILFFLGEELHNDFSGTNYIYLPTVQNDYLSASYKQNLGLKYIYDHYTTDFVLMCGTDTFINIPKLLLFIKQYNPKENLYIGGHGDYRNIDNTPYYFHSGGPGFIITQKSLEMIYPFLDTMVEQWTSLCKTQQNNLGPACDVAIGYYLQKYTDVKLFKTNHNLFIHCNYKGIPCHQNNIDINKIISCHNMKLNDFDEFHTILVSNNFFI
uniref:Fringe-like glycosyltransferase domain-containing protein n=1 Tax=viral metagenome TaxID=1070528 RepID=A0A6C0AQ81_9ZZZZ